MGWRQPFKDGAPRERARQTGRLLQGRLGSVAMDEDHLMGRGALQQAASNFPYNWRLRRPEVHSG